MLRSPAQLWIDVASVSPRDTLGVVQLFFSSHLRSLEIVCDQQKYCEQKYRSSMDFVRDVAPRGNIDQMMPLKAFGISEVREPLTS